MNQLLLEHRAAIVRALVEGNSIRATARLTGTSKDTVLKLLVDVGEFCSIYQDHKLRKLTAKRVQCDEIWSFVGAKAKQVSNGAKGAGDVWTWTAMDADSKLMITWAVGKRDSATGKDFMADVASRLAHRVQLTSDGHRGYLDAVEEAFGSAVDYAQLVKLYGRDQGEQRRYSPAVCVGAIKQRVTGNPDEAYVSTSYAERANLTMRMGMRRFTRLTNAFSKKVENHGHAIALHFMHYNFCRPHQTLTKAAKGVHTTPAMAAGLTNRVWKIEDLMWLMDPNRLLQSA